MEPAKYRKMKLASVQPLKLRLKKKLKGLSHEIDFDNIDKK
jgi:hypothetical protein